MSNADNSGPGSENRSARSTPWSSTAAAPAFGAGSTETASIAGLDPSRLVLLLAMGVFAGQAFQYVPNLETYLDEGLYLMRGWWYLTGSIEPYSAEDATSYMPLYFFFVGAVQWLFGVGHASGRIASAVLGLASLLLSFRVGDRLFGSRVVGAVAALIVAANPIAVRYLTTATPYALVSFVSLLTLLLILDPRWARWNGRGPLMGTLFFILFFLRNNMIVAIVMMSAVVFLVEKPKEALGTLARAFSTAAILAAALLLWFGTGLLEIAGYLPVLSPAFWSLGIARGESYEMMTLTAPPSSIAWTWTSLWRHLIDDFVLTYPVTVMGAALATLYWIAARTRGCSIDAGLAMGFSFVYFVGMSATHLVGSQGYCPSCITPYANYFLFFGAFPAAWVLCAAGKRLVSSPDRGRPLAMAVMVFFAAVAAGNVFGPHASTYLMHLTQMPEPGKPLVTSLNEVGDDLTRLVSPGERVFALSDRPFASQAAFLAGAVVEPLSLSLANSYRRLTDDLSPPQRARALASLQAKTYWTDEILEDWLRARAMVLVTERLSAYQGRLGERVEGGLPLGSLVAEHFEMTGTANGGGILLEVYRRKQSTKELRSGLKIY